MIVLYSRNHKNVGVAHNKNVMKNQLKFTLATMRQYWLGKTKPKQEILGVWGSCASSLVQWIGSWVMEQSGDNRATQFFIQKVAIDVQRGNAASVIATIPSTQDWTFLPTV